MQPKTHFGIALALAMTMALGPLAVDTYLPAFPQMARALAVSVHHIALSISSYVFVLAISQLIGGPLSDHIGRARVMLTGLVIFAVASFLISRIDAIEQLILLRGVQAFGGGWAMVCVAAIVRDRLSGSEAARFFSLIGLIMIVAPAIAPGFGSLILETLGWRAIFLVLCGYGLFMIVLLKLVVFADRDAARPSQTRIPVWKRYQQVFATRPALRFLVIQALSFSVMLLFITHSAFIYQQHYGAGPVAFSFLFGANIVLMMIMNLTNRQLLKRLAPARILRWSLTLQAVGIGLLILVTAFSASLWLFLPAMMITVGAMGAITPNTQACFMEFFQEHGGTASALLGATQFLVSGLISAASALLPEAVIAIVLTQAACSIVCLGFAWGHRAA